MQISYITFGALYRDPAGRLSSELASARYRVLLPANELARRGHAVQAHSTCDEFWRDGRYAEIAGEVVVFSKSFDPRNEQLAQALKREGRRIVFDICDNHFDDPRLGQHFRRMVDLADVLIANTPAMAEIIRLVTAREPVIIGDSIEGPQGAPRFEPGASIRALWFGHPLNLDSLFAALPDIQAAVKHRSVQLELVTAAAPGLSERLMAWNRRCPDGPALSFTPWSLSNLARCLSACDLVLIPSLANDKKQVKSPNRIMETIWSGRLALAYPIPSYMEFANFAHIEENMGEALFTAINDPRRYQSRIAAGQDYIAAHYQPANIAQHWELALSRAMEPRTPRARHGGEMRNKPAASPAGFRQDAMKIVLFTLDRIEYPCPQIRIVEPVRALSDQVQVFSGVHLLQQGGAIEQILDPIDLVIFQRGFPRPELKSLCEFVLKSGKPVIYETDDYLQRVPKHHNKPAYDEVLAENIEWLARGAAMVTVSTTPLAEAYSAIAKQTVVLPNYLSPRLWNDTLLAPINPDRKRVRIGLVGSKNHDKDFSLIADLLDEALARYPHVDCVFYGALPEGIAASERIGFLPADYRYELHPQRLASLNIDIALAPLTSSTFNRAKSNIKFLEFGFLGIPGLYADLEPYRDSVAHGDNGLLCSTKLSSWREGLFELIEQPDLRLNMGKRARDTVVTQHMLSQHAYRWLDCYREAMKVQGGAITSPR